MLQGTLEVSRTHFENHKFQAPSQFISEIDKNYFTFEFNYRDIVGKNENKNY